MRFFYDLEGVAGFKLGYGGNGDKYTYIKDGQGNVIGLCGDNGIKARYIYDAWGQCKALDANGDEIKADDWSNPALLNPFRWKSLYYDNDTELYLIGDRWYDPERGRYISSASPEMLIENAKIIFFDFVFHFDHLSLCI